MASAGEGTSSTHPFVERRGLDAAVIALIKELHEQFVDSHAEVHDTFVQVHTREHELGSASHERALQISHETLRKEIQHILDTMNERDRRYQERHESDNKAVQAAFESAEKAIVKAETSIEKRADATYVSLTELQKNLASLMPRQEAENRFAANRALIGDLQDRVKGLEANKEGGREAVTNMQMLLGIIIALLVIGGYLSTRIG